MEKERWTFCAIFSHGEATTTAVGMRCMVSFANEGPDRHTRYGCISAGSTSSSTSYMVRSDSFSIPLLAQTIGVAFGNDGNASRITARVTWLGLTATTSSAPPSAWARSCVAVTLSGSLSPGRYLGFSWRAEMSRAASASCDQTVVSCPLCPSTDASAVPQLPPPITAARMARS